MEQNLSTDIIRTPPTGVGVSEHIKVHYQFCTLLMQMHQEILWDTRLHNVVPYIHNVATYFASRYSNKTVMFLKDLGKDWCKFHGLG